MDKNRPYAQVLGEFVGEEEVASYTYGLDLISQERNGVDSFYFVDGLGSTRGLTDGDGGVTDAYWYDAYGNLVDRVGSSENDYLFAGEQFDEGLGQYYLRQRYYDAATGRFTRRDTWERNRTNPITLNKYLYANGNPVSYIDPSGLFSLGEVSAANSIANILNQIQFDSGTRFLAMAAGGEEPQPKDFMLELFLGLSASFVLTFLPYFLKGFNLYESVSRVFLLKYTKFPKIKNRNFSYKWQKHKDFTNTINSFKLVSYKTLATALSQRSLSCINGL